MQQLPIPSASIEAFIAKREAAADLINQVFEKLLEVDILLPLHRRGRQKWTA